MHFGSFLIFPTLKYMISIVSHGQPKAENAILPILDIIINTQVKKY